MRSTLMLAPAASPTILDRQVSGNMFESARRLVLLMRAGSEDALRTIDVAFAKSAHYNVHSSSRRNPDCVCRNANANARRVRRVEPIPGCVCDGAANSPGITMRGGISRVPGHRVPAYHRFIALKNSSLVLVFFILSS